MLSLARGPNAAALRQTLPGSTVTAAEILHAARAEMAETLADVVFRRTDLATAGNPRPKALDAAAALVAEAKAWDKARAAQERAAVEARLRELGRSGRAMLADRPTMPSTPAPSRPLKWGAIFQDPVVGLPRRGIVDGAVADGIDFGSPPQTTAT